MKNIKNLSDFIHKDSNRDVLNSVLIAPDKIVATDSFKLVEIKTETGISEPLLVKLPKGIKTFESVHSENGIVTIRDKKGAGYQVDVLSTAYTFPEYEKLIPTTEPKLTVRLSPEYLAQVAKAFEGDVYVEIALHGNAKPLVFTSDSNVRVLLMPINK